ncbi:MAG: hypothetical protein M3O36_02230 [Myxococcota bacterium]|nr:hypothetical protein [Myxococcota bacterium]
MRICTRLTVPLRDRLTKHCAASGISERAVIEAALRQYLEGTSDAALVLRRLDRLDVAIARDHHDLELLSEAFGIYLRQWFARTPPMPEEAKPAARRAAEAQWKQFAEHLAERFSGGHRFLDGLPKAPSDAGDEIGRDD